jgi:6-phosphofructokinase 1
MNENTKIEVVNEIKKPKRIGVLTSGGDAPGMNAALRAVVRSGIYRGFEVYGIRKGYEGLLSGDMYEMNLRSVSDIISRGGTILQTARCPEFTTEEGVLRGYRMAQVFKLDAIVVIGGDGSFRGARDLARLGMNVMGIPATIDNDIDCTDHTIGFDTALNTVKDAIDKIKDTAYSHERCSVVEVMGREAGYIALSCAIADGAEACILPERHFDIDTDIIQPIIGCRNRGKHHYIVIIAEGVGGTIEIAKQIKEITGISTNATILGHLQRGGSPTVKDRVSASMMAVKATEALANGERNKIIALKNEKYITIDIEEALQMKKHLDPDMIEASKMLSL